MLGVTGLAKNIPQAVQAAYRGVARIHFEGAHYRKDIAHAALGGNTSLYKIAGVDIDAGNRAVDLIRDAVKSTYNKHVLAEIGSFGGLFDAANLIPMKSPVLVASTDGVGTKVKLAASLGRFRGLGIDIVNHCINDILVQGAQPLFFLDYFAASRLQPELLAEIVSGMAEACRQAGCVLLGGETAEMPGFTWMANVTSLEPLWVAWRAIVFCRGMIFAPEIGCSVWHPTVRTPTAIRC